MIISTFFIFFFFYILTFFNIIFRCRNYIKCLPLLFLIIVKLADVCYTLFTRESIDDLAVNSATIFPL